MCYPFKRSPSSSILRVRLYLLLLSCRNTWHRFNKSISTFITSPKAWGSKVFTSHLVSQRSLPDSCLLYSLILLKDSGKCWHSVVIAKDNWSLWVSPPLLSVCLLLRPHLWLGMMSFGSLLWKDPFLLIVLPSSWARALRQFACISCHLVSPSRGLTVIIGSPSWDKWIVL